MACTAPADRNHGLTDFACGADFLPEEISPVEAPFPMPEFRRPSFPDRKINVRMNSEGLSTANIQNAVDEIASKGGGTVVIPRGEWYSGRISLRSNVNLELRKGSVLHFSGDIADYRPAVRNRDEGVDIYSLGAFIYAYKENNVAVTGGGRIVGPSTDCEIYSRNSSVTPSIEVAADKPLEDRVFDGRDGGAVYLPKTICFVECGDAFVEGVTLDNGLFWNVVMQYCKGVVIRGVRVNSYGHGRTDGIDIDSSRDVLIEYCTLDCQDDCYTMKSGRGKDGVDKGIPTENVVVRNCVALRGAGGLVCGTETAGGVRNIYMRDCLFNGTDQGFRFKSRRPRGGGIENVYAENVRLKVLREVLYADMLGSARYVGALASRYPTQPVTRYTPYLRNISIHDIQVDSAGTLVNFTGLPENISQNVFLGNADVKCGKLGKVQDCYNFSIKDIKVETQDSVFTIDNCDKASFFGFNNVSTDSAVNIRTVGECKYLYNATYPLHSVKYSSISPGKVWLDTGGKPIQAHGFQVTYRDGKYYWYGEDKSGTLFGTNRIFCGVRCYSSEDFYNWEDLGDILVPSADPSSPMHHSQKLERPHIVYSRNTGKYVCWLKAQANDGYFVVAQADSFTGPYTYVRSLKPDGYAVGDFDMYTDEETGKSYVWFERPHSEYICAELDDECTGVTDVFSTHFSGKVPPFTREAAAHFVKDGRHYMFTSGTTGYTPNPSEVAVFDDYHGEYTVLGDSHPDDPYRHSFCSQITSVIRIPGSDLYVAMADRWQPHTLNSDIPVREFESFRKRYVNHVPFPLDFEEPKVVDRYYTLVNHTQDVYKATYVFLPVVFDGGIPVIRWMDEWKLETFTKR